MYIGWLVLGDRLTDGTHFEIINNARALSYATGIAPARFTPTGGGPLNQPICWLVDVDPCEAVMSVTPGAPYSTPSTDPAPWYDPNNPDTADFYGVVGIDVIGAESSTRSATVTMAASGGGVVGPLIFGPRTMVVRGLAIAANDCGLQAGLNWLNMQYALTVDQCIGDALTFFDCCPCICGTTDEIEVCWARTYQELREGPNGCEPDWWPKTYQELRLGPPIASETWCAWVVIYRHLRLDGPPTWSCCADQCVVPYLRQFLKVRIVQGPAVTLHRESMPSGGAMAVFEFTIVAADPVEYTSLEAAAVLNSVGAGSPAPVPLAAESLVAYDPFAPAERAGRTALLEPVAIAVDETTWLRETVEVPDVAKTHLSDDQAYVIAISAPEGSQAVRIGVWREGALLNGFRLPSIPADATITLDGQGRNVNADYAGTTRPINGFARGYDGVTPVSWATIAHGPLTLTVDRVDGDTAPVGVRFWSASVGV